MDGVPAGGDEMTAWRNRIVGEGDEPPDQLLANPMNFRTHPGTQADALRGVLADVGWVQRIIVNRRSGHVVDGHLRVAEALKAGAATVPVLYVDLDEAEERLILSTLDPLSAMAGTDAAQLDALLREVSTDSPAVAAMLDALAQEAGIVPSVEPGAGGDEFDPTPDDGPTRCQPGDLWVIGGVHRLIIGDSTDPATVARLMGGERARFVWGDPPYGIALDEGAADDRRRLNNGSPISESKASWDGALMTSWIGVWRPVLTDGGYLSSWGPYHGIGAIEGVALSAGLLWLNLFTWIKENAAPGFPEYLTKSCEHAPIFRAPGSGRYIGDGLVRDYAATPMTEQSERWGDHPSPKRLDVLMPIIEKLTPPDGIVADPFLGSGTTLIAAHRTGRRCYGVEIDPRYGDVILRRAEAEVLTVERANG